MKAPTFIHELNLSSRIVDVMRNLNIETISEFCDMDGLHLLMVNNFGIGSLYQIVSTLIEHGIHLKNINVSLTNFANYPKIAFPDEYYKVQYYKYRKHEKRICPNCGFIMTSKRRLFSEQG